MSKSLEDLIAEVNRKGWLVNNLFQTNSGLWHCGVRSDQSVGAHDPGSKGGYNKVFTEFCEGKTPGEALAGVLKDMNQPRNKRPVAAALADDLADI